jgi:hypothetical protein
VGEPAVLHLPRIRRVRTQGAASGIDPRVLVDSSREFTGAHEAQSTGGRMNQPRLPFARQKPTVLSKRKSWDLANLESARLILENPDRYAGIQVEWAERIVRKSEAQ